MKQHRYRSLHFRCFKS